MTNIYTKDSDAADKEWLYENFFQPGDVMDDLYDDEEDEEEERDDAAEWAEFRAKYPLNFEKN